ncbi:MAG: AMP-binding protein, partial [Deferribacterota bacterium]|nr:AMP-binding protein [Deferribacterota bacterium]
DIIEKYKVTGIFFSPTGVRSLLMVGIEEARKHDLSSVERIVCAGEVLNPPAWKWLQKDVFNDKIPVIDHMWQTESSAPIFANPYGLEMFPIKPGSAGKPVPGIISDIVDEFTGRSLLPGEKGTVIIKKPWPGLTPTLYKDPESYKREYWERTPGTLGAYYCGDAATFDTDGYIWFTGRSDEVINIAAHRVGTIEVENILMDHPAVGEAAVSGVPDELRGEVCSAFVVLKPGYSPSPQLKKELIKHVRDVMGPIIVFKDIECVKMLPKTRSGKIMRRVLKKLWTKEDLGDLSTIEDGTSIDEIKEGIRRMGIKI